MTLHCKKNEKEKWVDAALAAEENLSIWMVNALNAATGK
jgi:hypothetical protein